MQPWHLRILDTGGSCHFLSQHWPNTQGREQSSPINSTVLTEMAWRRYAKLNFLFSKELPQFSLFNITSCHNNLSPKNMTSPRPCSWPIACLTFQGFFGCVHLITWLEGLTRHVCWRHSPSSGAQTQSCWCWRPPALQVPASSRDTTPTIWTWRGSCLCLLPTSTPSLHQRPHAGHAVTSVPSHIGSHTLLRTSLNQHTPPTRCPELNQLLLPMGPEGLYTSVSGLGGLFPLYLGCVESTAGHSSHSYQVFLRIRSLWKWRFHSSFEEGISPRFTLYYNQSLFINLTV